MKRDACSELPTPNDLYDFRYTWIPGYVLATNNEENLSFPYAQRAQKQFNFLRVLPQPLHSSKTEESWFVSQETWKMNLRNQQNS